MNKWHHTPKSNTSQLLPNNWVVKSSKSLARQTNNNNKQQANNKQQTTNNKQQTTNNKQQTNKLSFVFRVLILKGEGNTEALELDRGKMRPRKTPAAETAGNQKAT